LGHQELRTFNRPAVVTAYDFVSYDDEPPSDSTPHTIALMKVHPIDHGWILSSNLAAWTSPRGLSERG
jgi:hypothetical protein